MSTAHAPVPTTVDEWAAWAPGRVNLIGEHTDYNEGLVLPVAISLGTRIRARARRDDMVAMTLAATGEVASFDLDAIGGSSGSWIDYAKGVANVLQAEGYRLAGIDATIESTLPMSAGLSSSASFELAIAWALLGPAGPAARGIDALALARICQRAENTYVGVASGLMDQFAASCGQRGAAMLLDCRSLEHRAVPLPAALALVALDTGARRRLAASEYNERRRQCEEGVSILAARGLPVRTLRDVTLEMLDGAAPELDPVTMRRCRHVVEENERVLETVDALAAGDRQALGALFAASHASLRDLFEVSSPALDAAVDIATRTPGVIATRMTGAGFGGCTVAMVEPDAVERLRDAIEREYRPLTGLDATVHVVDAVDGARYEAVTP